MSSTANEKQNYFDAGLSNQLAAILFKSANKIFSDDLCGLSFDLVPFDKMDQLSILE